MDYYNYSSYFNSIINKEDTIISNQEKLYTIIQNNHSEIINKIDNLNNTIQSGFTTITIFIVIATTIKVIFGK